MDHILRLHVEHHTAARLGKGVDASSRAFLVLAAVAMFLAAAAAGSLALATTKAALFVLSNAIILALLAADCRCFFYAAGESAPSDAVVVVDACEEEPAASGHVLEKQGRHHQQCAVQSQEEQKDVPPASRPEQLLGLPDQGESIAIELEATLVQERTCKTESGLDELGIEDLNKKFDEFIQSKRSKWMKEEAYLQLHC